MNSKWKLSSLSLGVVASLATGAAPGAPAPACAMPQYTVTDLGVLGKGNNATANDMNSIGWVAGQSNLVANGPQHSFLWYGAGPLVDIGTLGGPNSGAAGLTCMARLRLSRSLPRKILITKTFAPLGPISSAAEPSGVTAN